MKRSICNIGIALACAAGASIALNAAAAPVVFSGSGADAATALDAFRAALGAKSAGTACAWTATITTRILK